MPTETDTARKLADFAGHWLLERQITPAQGPRARFTGHARWTPEGCDLRYVEEGALQIDGQAQVQATRAYLWQPDLTVWFSDGRLFHQVPPLGGPAAHWCPPDQYDGSYDFQGWPVFRVTWDVKGPRKDYRMVSDYRRA